MMRRMGIYPGEHQIDCCVVVTLTRSSGGAVAVVMFRLPQVQGIDVLVATPGRLRDLAEVRENEREKEAERERVEACRQCISLDARTVLALHCTVRPAVLHPSTCERELRVLRPRISHP